MIRFRFFIMKYALGLLFTIFFISAGAQDSTVTAKTVILKTSPSQFFGLRFPLIIEKCYDSRLSTEVGFGPTIGKRFLGFMSDYNALLHPEYESTEYTDFDKSKVGIHLQAQQRIYFQANTYDRHYISLFLRYGYFSTETLQSETFLEKNQGYITYGFKKSEGKLFVDYWIGSGLGVVRHRFHRTQLAEDGSGSVLDVGFEVQKTVLFSFAMGINMGFSLK